MPNLTNAAIATFVFLFAMFTLAYFGKKEADKQHQQWRELQLQQYCDNVGTANWPDYLGIFKAECGGKDPPKYSEEIAK